MYRLQIQKKSTILDVGCGKGRHSIYFNTKGMHVIGIDLSRNNINIAKETMKAFSSRINGSGTGFSMMLHAIDYDFGPSNEVIIVGDINDPKTKKILNQVYRSKNLNKVIILIDSNQKKRIIDLIPFSEFYFNKEGPIAYICKDYTCDLPTNDLVKIKELLEY